MDDLRHTAATFIVDVGGNIGCVRTQLGLSSLTKTYNRCLDLFDAVPTQAEPPAGDPESWWGGA